MLKSPSILDDFSDKAKVTEYLSVAENDIIHCAKGGCTSNGAPFVCNKRNLEKHLKGCMTLTKFSVQIGFFRKCTGNPETC